MIKKLKITRPNNAFILGEGKCCVTMEEREEVDESRSPKTLCNVFEKSEPSDSFYRLQVRS